MASHDFTMTPPTRQLFFVAKVLCHNLAKLRSGGATLEAKNRIATVGDCLILLLAVNLSQKKWEELYVSMRHQR